ncbi:chloride channel protein [Clostridium sp.]|uniref:chloride channel protein n=1 Tax=Clostridium sp. TaxID=1506 RepID=UPI00341857C0
MLLLLEKKGSVVAIGGTLGDFIARKFNLTDDEQRTLVICGVGSAFGVIYDVLLQEQF